MSACYVFKAGLDGKVCTGIGCSTAIFTVACKCLLTVTNKRLQNAICTKQYQSFINFAKLHY